MSLFLQLGDADLLESDGLRQGEKLDLQHQVPCQEKHDSTDNVSLLLDRPCQVCNRRRY